MSALSLDWNFRAAKTKQELIDQISQKAAKKKLNPQVTNTMITFYDEIMGNAKVRLQEAMAMYRKLNDDFERISVQFSK